MEGTMDDICERITVVSLCVFPCVFMSFDCLRELDNCNEYSKRNLVCNEYSARMSSIHACDTKLRRKLTYECVYE